MRLLSHGAIYIGGEVISKLIPFLMLPYLTRELGTVGFGELSYYLVIYTFSLIFISISQDGALGRYFFRYGQKGIPSIMVTGFFFAFIVTLVIISGLALGKLYIYICPVLLAFTQTIVSSLLSLRQCQQAVLSYVKIQFIVSLTVSLLTILAFEWVNASAVVRINAMIIGQIISIILVVLGSTPKVDLGRFTLYRLKKHFVYIIGFGVPLIIHQLSFFGKGQFDRFLIPQAFTVSQLGLYSAAFQLASILTVILYAINKAIVPILYSKLKNKSIGKKEILRFARLSLIIAPIPSLVAFLIPNEFYIFILGEDFDGAKYYVYIFLIGLSLHLSYQVLANFLFYHGQNLKVAFATSISLIVHVLAVLLFAHFQELKLLPYAIAISNMVVIALLYLKVQNYKVK